jgi:hypothetical protein
VFVLATAVGWWSDLPATLPQQWSNGGGSATMPLWAFFVVVLVIAAGTATGALFTIPHNAAPNRRVILYATGAAGAAAAGVWACGGGLFGLIPMLLATRWNEPEGGL